MGAGILLPVNVRRITTWDALATQHALDWQRLVAASTAATLFQTWEWSAAWWKHQGRGKRLFALVVSDNDTVVGIAPFFTLPGPLRTLQLVGTGGSDYLDLLAAPGQEAAVAAAVAQWLRENRSAWDWADLQQIKPGAVAEQLPGADLWEGETCPYLPLPETYDAFLKTLGKKHRQNIGYYERAMGKLHTLELRVTTEATFDFDLDAFFRLHQLRWRSRWMPGAFAAASARAFHRDAAYALLQSGNLRLHTLLLDGEAVASIYCFHKSRTTYYYLGGFEPALAKLSLGTVLTARAIRHAIEADGATEFDFLRGNEGYKYRWGAQDRYNRRVSLTRRGLRSPLLATVGKLALSLELRLKHAMHARHGGAGKG